MIFGATSMERRAEPGASDAWIRWLKAQFDDADRVAAELTARVLSESSAPKLALYAARWRVTVRLESSSHSIRPKAFEKWNAASAHIKIRADHNDKSKRGLFVDVELPASVPVASVWYAGLELCNRLIVALNIGSLGFFWWHTGTRTTRYYEKILDLENGNAELLLTFTVDGGHGSEVSFG